MLTIVAEMSAFPSEIFSSMLTLVVKEIDQQPYAYRQFLGRFTARLDEISRATRNRELRLAFLLLVTLRNVMTEWGDRLLRRMLRKGELADRLAKKGFSAGEITAILGAVQRFDLVLVLTTDRTTDAGSIRRELGRELDFFSDQARVDQLSWEVVGTVDETLRNLGRGIGPEISRQLTLLADKGRKWEELHMALEEAILLFDGKVAEEMFSS